MKRLFPATLGLLAALTFVTASGFAADKKKDPDEIGNRDVGKGVNFYSLEKEIALGKGLANEVERVWREEGAKVSLKAGAWMKFKKVAFRILLKLNPNMQF